MTAPYLQQGLTLSLGGTANTPGLVVALQRDLRALGYLASGIDGQFGPGTQAAIRALQYDLLHNSGASTAKDGGAPVAVTSFNQGPDGAALVTAVTGVLDQALATAMVAMIGADGFTKVPSSASPTAANQSALADIAAENSTVAPAAFVLALLAQESGSQHFRVPSGANQDNFVVVGTDRNLAGQPDAITSRGYGIGQYTFFHHPPSAQEMQDYILDPVKNVTNTFTLLGQKFADFVAGPADTADDRMAAFPGQQLRPCCHPAGDPLYLADCHACVQKVPTVNTAPGQPVYAGASLSWQTTQYYASASYQGVPDPAQFPCDWPYAARRYNGSGINSYHYQAHILLNLKSQADMPQTDMPTS